MEFDRPEEAKTFLHLHFTVTNGFSLLFLHVHLEFFYFNWRKKEAKKAFCRQHDLERMSAGVN